MNILEYLEKEHFNTVDNSFYSYIDQWLEWYKGKVEKFHKYNVYNGIQMVGKERYSLGMAKRVSEDWANLLMNEKVSISCDKLTDLEDIFEYNNFNVRANQLIELTYALGTGAFVEYLGANGEIIIDYIRADMIYPLAWENGDITECAFGSNRKIDGEECIYIQMHVLENGLYTIKNRLVKVESGLEVGMENVAPEVLTGSSRPLFQIITPNIVNNVDLDCPMGISIYANAIDQLKGVDLVYDSYMNEFDLGKKRVLVPASMAKIQMASDGTTRPVFDTNDTTFYAIDDGALDTVKEIDMKIRAEEHEKGLQRALNLLSSKCGLGNDRYSFEKGTAKTATEVISEKSDLYQNLKKNEIPLRTALIGMVKGIAYLSGKGDVEVTVDFDDSVIEDDNAIVNRNIQLVSSELRSKLKAIMEIDKVDEEGAQKELDRITQERSIGGTDADMFGLNFGNQEENPKKERDDE